jgi:hypothetical protein
VREPRRQSRLASAPRLVLEPLLGIPAALAGIGAPTLRAPLAFGTFMALDTWAIRAAAREHGGIVAGRCGIAERAAFAGLPVAAVLVGATMAAGGGHEW